MLKGGIPNRWKKELPPNPRKHALIISEGGIPNRWKKEPPPNPQNNVEGSVERKLKNKHLPTQHCVGGCGGGWFSHMGDVHADMSSTELMYHVHRDAGKPFDERLGPCCGM